jgi:hypothetical protein
VFFELNRTWDNCSQCLSNNYDMTLCASTAWFNESNYVFDCLPDWIGAFTAASQYLAWSGDQQDHRGQQQREAVCSPFTKPRSASIYTSTLESFEDLFTQPCDYIAQAF